MCLRFLYAALVGTAFTFGVIILLIGFVGTIELLYSATFGNSDNLSLVSVLLLSHGVLTLLHIESSKTNVFLSIGYWISLILFISVMVSPLYQGTVEMPPSEMTLSLLFLSVWFVIPLARPLSLVAKMLRDHYDQGIEAAQA